MALETPSLSVKRTGFTVLQEGGSDPDCDIVFVHGLHGKPDKSWTYHGTSSDSPGSTGNPSNDKLLNRARSFLGRVFKKNEKKANTSDGHLMSEAVEGTYACHICYPALLY